MKIFIYFLCMIGPLFLTVMLRINQVFSKEVSDLFAFISVVNLFFCGNLFIYLLNKIFPGFEKFIFDESKDFKKNHKQIINNNFSSNNIIIGAKENNAIIKTDENVDLEEINIPRDWRLNDGVVGVYKITNILNAKVYIGESINIEKRWKKHFYDLTVGRHHNYKLQKDFDSHGEDSFFPKVIKRIEYTTYDDTKKRLLIEEQKQIKYEIAQGNDVYNLNSEDYKHEEKTLSYGITSEYIGKNNQKISDFNNLSKANLKTENKYVFPFDIKKETERKENEKSNLRDIINYKDIVFKDRYDKFDDNYDEYHNSQNNSLVNDEINTKDLFFDYRKKIFDNWEDIVQCLIKGYTLQNVYEEQTTNIEQEYVSIIDFVNICKEIKNKNNKR